MSQRSIASGSSRREFLKAGAAAVALPAAVGLPDACQPARPVDGDQAKHAAARRLTAFTGGQIAVSFEPGVFFDDEEESAGHLYYGLIQMDDSGVLTLDDRQAGPLEAQLVEQLREFAQTYIDLAADLAERIRV